MRHNTEQAVIVEIQRSLRWEFGLNIPFTAAEFRTALDRVRASRGVLPGRSMRRQCPRLRANHTFTISVPAGVTRVEQEHIQFHQLAHIALQHIREAGSAYSDQEEDAAEAFA